MLETGFLADRAKVLQIASFSLAESIRSGSFKSVFRGAGIEFDEVRSYQRGDDVRSIDWNITARMGSPYVKRFREEREVTTFLVLDASLSMDCSSGAVSRRHQSWITAALLAFSSVRNRNPVGAVFFDGGAGKLFPASSGMAYCMAVLTAMENFVPEIPGSQLSGALAGADRSLKKRSLVAVISDFRTDGYEQSLGQLCRRHDVIAIRVTDPVDRRLPPLGYVSLTDAETGTSKMFASSSPAAGSLWEQFHLESLRKWRHICHRCGAVPVEISTEDDPIKKLLDLFNERQSRLSQSSVSFSPVFVGGNNG